MGDELTSVHGGTVALPADGADETLAERAYRLIEDLIVRLDLAPGARLTEQELAQRVGLGRTPVREALQRLVADGLVVVFPRKGIAVSAINPLDVLLALDTRAVLERLVAGAAARRAGPKARADLRRLAGEMQAAAEAGHLERYMQVDKAVDRLLGESAGNPFAVRALVPLESMARRAWFYFRGDADLVPAAARHARILAAIADGDAAAAEAASDALVAHVREGIKAAIAAM